MESSDQSQKSNESKNKKEYRFEVVFSFSMPDDQGDLDFKLKNYTGNYELIATFLHFLTDGQLNEAIYNSIVKSAPSTSDELELLSKVLERWVQMKQEDDNKPLVDPGEVFIR